MSEGPVVAIIQARMGSTRLPGKVMLNLGGRPTIEHVVMRVRAVPGIDHVIVATTVLPEDEPLIGYLQSIDVPVVRGPAQDVLTRYWRAAQESHAAIVVRITSDCPLIAPSVSAKVIQRFFDGQPGLDYCSNTIERSYPRGLDTEVFSMEVLAVAHAEATALPDREHVTPYLYRRPERFRVAQVVDAVDRSHLRWTLDTREDYDLLSRIYDELGESGTLADYEDILEVVAKHPEWSEINRHVVQKQYGE